MTERSKLSAHRKIDEPNLLFNDDKIDIHPLRGLINYGPYSKRYEYLFEIQIAFIAPKGFPQKLDKLLSELRSQYCPIEAKDYYPDYPGFEQLFRVPIISPSNELKIEISENANYLAHTGQYQLLADRIIDSLRELLPRKSNFHLVYIYLPRSWEKCFRVKALIFTITSKLNQLH